jgi:hypothetical protein
MASQTEIPSQRMRPPSNSGAAAGTRWDHVRLNRLIGSIPVAPMLALAEAAGDASHGKPGDALSSASGLARHPAGLSLQDKFITLPLHPRIYGERRLPHSGMRPEPTPPDPA